MEPVKKIIIFHKKNDKMRKIIIRFPSFNILFWLLRSIIITIFFCREAEKYSVKGVQCAVSTIFMESCISDTALFFSHNFICRACSTIEMCTQLHFVNDNYYDGISITENNSHLNAEIPFSYKK